MRGLNRVIAMTLLVMLSASSMGQDLDRSVDQANKGWSMEQDRDPAWLLAQSLKLDKSLKALLPQRPGIVDAYVVVVGLDADPVFGRETQETAKVLTARYGAIGRTVVLTTGNDIAGLQGSPTNIATTLAAVAAQMNVKEDVLVLYTTSHGDPDIGIVYKDPPHGFGMIAPKRLAGWLNDLGIERRLVMISACYSGVFIPELQNDTSVVMTAAASDRSSFGCTPSNDWTYFGDAMINNALRKPQSIGKAFGEAATLINQWELKKGLKSSNPQSSVGAKAGLWLAPLEARIPKTVTARVGKPAIDDELPTGQ
jgi:hypothetical protein